MKVSYPAEKNTSLQNGFYPIGYYHCWHGGIHIEGVENKTPIKAIADGKIIAFRYNQELKKVKGKEGKEFFFSNNFVVIRHDYESSGKKKMTFYSLYQHLSFGSQQQKEESKPKEQNKENIYTVKIKVFKQESGVFSSDGKSFIPLYSQVQIQSKDEVQGIYQVAFEGKNVQIPQEKNQTKTLNQSGRIVFWGDKRGDRGLLLYSEARSNTPTKGVIKDGEKVTILDKTEVQGKDKKHTWYKVGYQGKEGFILEEHLATKPSESKETQKNDTGKTATKPNLLPKFLKSYDPKDEVVTCDIDVKAGELIGWVGKQGLFNNPDYVAAHIEVFTPDDGDEFIKNTENQGEGEKFYFELPKGTELKPYLKLRFVSPLYYKGIRVEVLSKTKTYAKIRPIEDVFIKEPTGWTICEIVDGKAIEKRWLSPEKRKTFWIENEYVELAKGKKEYVFTSSLSHIYLTDPERESQTRSKGRVYEDKLAKTVTIDIRLCKEKINYDKAEWIYVKSHYYREGKTIYNQGWVEIPKKEERFSAYHWDKFGFKTYDAENHRMYPIKGVNNYEGTSEFIKKIIALIDKNKDGKIQNEELQACYNKPELSHIFSRMVCKHKSEWSYAWSKIERDGKKFFKHHYPDAEDDKIQERLDEIKAKYDALYDFWDKLNFKTDTFWYFEPFAWVEQMKRVFSSIKGDIDLRPLMTFEPQKGRSDCNITCKRIMKRMGVVPEGATIKAKKYPFTIKGKQRYESYYQLADENEERTELIIRNNQILEEANNYLDKSLEYGHPILVGVNHTFDYRSSEDYINETTTDHYVIIVGRKTINNELRYIFWDVGTSRGASTEWYFIKQNDGTLFAPRTYKSNNKTFKVIQIRSILDENNKIIKY